MTGDASSAVQVPPVPPSVLPQSGGATRAAKSPVPPTHLPRDRASSRTPPPELYHATSAVLARARPTQSPGPERPCECAAVPRMDEADESGAARLRERLARPAALAVPTINPCGEGAPGERVGTAAASHQL